MASFLSKALFLAAWALVVLAVVTRRLRLAPERAVLATLLAFSALYGLLSAQYLLWVVPLGLLRPGRVTALHAAAATAGLVGFYLFLAPGVLAPAPLEGDAALRAGRLWLFGAAATFAVSFAWLVTVVREGREGFRAATDARTQPSDLALALTDHLERRDEADELAGLEQVVRARGAPPLRLLRRVRLVEEQPARLQRPGEGRERAAGGGS